MSVYKVVTKLLILFLELLPPTVILPSDELDLRVTNFYRVYGKKNHKIRRKKKGVKKKKGIFPDMSNVVWSV